MQRFENGLDDAIALRQHISIPESQDAKSVRPQECVPGSVMGRLVQVLAAVELNYETSFKTYEVADIDAKGMLPPELEAIELATTQMAP
jgi:hypothetical protein